MEKLTKGYMVRLVTFVLFIILTASGIGFSIYLFYIASNTAMYLLAAAFTILAIVSGFFNIFASFFYYRSYFYERKLEGVKKTLKEQRTWPTIAVSMAVFNESPKIVERNMMRLHKIEYQKDKLRFYLLDDSTNTAMRQIFHV